MTPRALRRAAWRVDWRALTAEPVVATVVAILFVLLGLFIVYPLARVL